MKSTKQHLFTLKTQQPEFRCLVAIFSIDYSKVYHRHIKEVNHMLDRSERKKLEENLF
ncbi:hypothetical protein [Abyssogena phaseoliformis symbiont]|uniref:hypothetical protein n=1 Tax=Abyssogena phaseoliformis symbiont TaxID=596095 RepID=UPI001915AB41|nr:hypothetical protein [Abyssogena phaseoliformis symbiont]